MGKVITTDSFTAKTGQRLQVLSLAQAGLLQRDIALQTGLKQPAISKIIKKARAEGWDPKEKGRIDLKLVVDKERKGRPRKVTKAMERKIGRTLERGSRHEREQTSAAIAYKHGLSQSTILRIC